MRNFRKVLILIMIGVTVTALSGCAQPAKKSDSREAGWSPQQKWFSDAKFGLFIHWGIYSVLGGEWNGKSYSGEWIMEQAKIPAAEYEKIAGQFNPVKFDPAEWVKIAKDAGMKYITITSKHHDGFAMFDSKVSNYDIVDSTPYKKDVLKMLADECEKQNMPLFFYYSQLDWRNPDYFPRGQTGHNAGRPNSGDFDKYIDYMNAQLAELCSGRYGKIAGIWFDGWWDQQKRKGSKQSKVNWRLKETYDLIHRLQPQALIGSNHHEAPFEGEDFQMFEKGVPGKDVFSESGHVSQLPLETCDTINGSWGYKKSDRGFKSSKQLLKYLIRSAGYGANFLLNVGPMPTGQIQPECVVRLREMGKWLAKNGESIYSTRGGPMPPQDWGVMTRKANKCYVHIIKRPKEKQLVLPGTEQLRVKRAYLFGDGQKIKYSKNGDITLDINDVSIDRVDTIVVLEIKK